MSNCYKCKSTTEVICTVCHKPVCSEHTTMKLDQTKTEMYQNQSMDKNLVLICMDCQKREQRKRLILLSAVAGVIIVIGIIFIVLRLGGYWFW